MITPITAVYSGDAQFAPNTSSPTTQLVNPLNTSTKITPSVSSGTFGEFVTFSAKVTSASGAPRRLGHFQRRRQRSRHGSGRIVRCCHLFHQQPGSGCA